MPGLSLSYRDYVAQFSERYAAYGHLHLQLVNEATAGDLSFPLTDDSNWMCVDPHAPALVLQSFTQDMAGLIHRNAPKALVALGTRGQDTDCGIGTDTQYRAIAQLIDVCEIHSYSEEADLLAQRLSACRNAEKPTLIAPYG